MGLASCHDASSLYVTIEGSKRTGSERRPAAKLHAMIAAFIAPRTRRTWEMHVQRQVWVAHPFVWALGCGLVAVCAIVLATTVLRDPHGTDRRTFLRQCHDQALDRGVSDQCASLAVQQFGRFDGANQSVAYAISAIAVFVGTLFVLLYVMREVGQTAKLRG